MGGGHVTVALTAAKPDAFKPETLQFVQMLGRIRAVVMDQCPTAEHIAFDGVAQQRPVLSIEMTRLTRWRRMVQLDPRTRRPPCPAQEPASGECGRRADAYLVTHRLMRGARFAQTELTTVLDDWDGAHALWVSGEMIGKLTIKEQSEFAGRYASNGQLADAISAGIGAQCGHDGAVPEQVWSQTWSQGSPREVAARGFSCRPTAGPPSHQAVLVTSVGPRLHVFALLAAGNHADTVRAASTDLALAIGEAR
jgi:hypothetical protein